MSGLFALSIDPRKYKGDPLSDLFWGTFYQQHRGEDYAGLSTLEGERIKIRTHRGLFRSTFSGDLEGLEGTEGIGFCGPDREPFLVDSRLGEFSACFSGNIINLDNLVGRFKDFGHSFARNGDDIEIITKLIAQGDNIVDGIRRMANEIEGAYSLLLLTPNGIYASLDPTAHWPLVIGQKDGAVAVASESAGFSNLGFALIRDLEPGETVLVREGRFETQDITTGGIVQYCSFAWVYTGFPTSIFRGIPVSLIRKRLGACHARRDIERGFIPDVIILVPDSGRFYAIGYYQEFCRQMAEGKTDKIPRYEEVLLKYTYAGRSYPRLTQEERDIEAHIKLLISGEDYKDIIAVVIDDSTRRGTQIQRNLVPKLRALGIKEIHLRIGNPDSLSYCRWGKTIQKGELLASRLPSKEDRIEDLGIDGLEYNEIDDLVEAIGLPREQLCVDCDLPPRETSF